MRYFKNPESFLSNEIYEFKIMSDFSNAEHKAIIEERNDRIYSLIMPLQISQLYDFLNNKIIQENKLKIESLFPDNVRYYQGNTQIKKSIINTINDTPKDFYKYNNGITIFSKKIFMKNQSGGHTISFQIQGINIINGQQTVIAIFDACKEMKRNNKDLPKNAYVLLKIFSNLNDQQLSNLSMFTNQQKSIKAFELLSTRKFNTMLQEKLIKEGIFYKPKKGKNSFTEQYKKWPQVELKDILKYWYIKEGGDVWVKNKVNKFMEALTFSSYLSKEVYQQYENIADKFKSMNNLQKVKTFKEIANVSVAIKLYKLKKDNTFIVKQSLDMYAYFLLLDRNKAENKKFINFFNNRVLSFSNIFLENDPSKNIANLFKTKKNSGRLFEELLLFFNNLQYSIN